MPLGWAVVRELPNELHPNASHPGDNSSASPPHIYKPKEAMSRTTGNAAQEGIGRINVV